MTITSVLAWAESRALLTIDVTGRSLFQVRTALRDSLVLKRTCADAEAKSANTSNAMKAPAPMLPHVCPSFGDALNAVKVIEWSVRKVSTMPARLPSTDSHAISLLAR